MNEEHFKDTPYPDLDQAPYTFQQDADNGGCWIYYNNKRIGEPACLEKVCDLVTFLNILDEQQGGLC